MYIYVILLLCGGDTVPIKYKIDILAELKKIGYSAYRLRVERIMGEATIQKLRNNEFISWATLEKVCQLLEIQPGDILCYEEDKKE